MNETKLDEASEKTSLFQSTKNSGTVGSNVVPSRGTWRATTSRLFLHHHHPQQRQQPQRSKTHQHLYRHHHYHHLHNKHTQPRPQGSPPKQPASQQLQRCNADQTSTVHQQHKQILLHHRNTQQAQSPIPQRKSIPSHFHAPHLHTHFRAQRHHSPLLPPKQRRKKNHLQITFEGQRDGSPAAPTVAESSTIQASTPLTRPPSVAPFLAARSECPHCGTRGTRLQQNQYHHPYNQHYQHQQPLRKGVPKTAHSSNGRDSIDNEGTTPHLSGGASVKHCCGRSHPPTTPTGSGGIITTTSISASDHLPTISDDHIVFIWDSHYCRSFQGIVRLLQVVSLSLIYINVFLLSPSIH